MHLTHSSTAKQEEKQEERGSCQTLNNIPLRSMLFNGGVPLENTRNRIETEQWLTMRPRKLTNKQPLTLYLFVFYHLANHIRI
jgi:hypothetical protein